MGSDSFPVASIVCPLSRHLAPARLQNEMGPESTREKGTGAITSVPGIGERSWMRVQSGVGRMLEQGDGCG